MQTGAVATVPTDAGMLALRRESAFRDVDDYDAWEERVNERLDEAIRAGELVPIGLQSDGAWDEEPGAIDADGLPSPDSLPNYLIEIAPARGDETFRQSQICFDPPDTTQD